MGRTDNRKAYKAQLVAFMSFLDDREYPKDQTFDNTRLLQITPQDVLRWFNLKAYGTENPSDDANPIECRSSSIEYAKKSLSSFMPNKPFPWNEATMHGNPTRSPLICEFLKKIRKKEVRSQGAPAMDVRPFTEGETVHILTHLRESPEGGIVTRYGVPALLCFEIHLLSRCDCASQLQTHKLRAHGQYKDFVLQAQLAWSKNVQQVGDAPWQIIIGQMNPMFCVLVSLSIWCEFYFGRTQGLSPYVYDFSGNFNIPKGGDASNDFVAKAVRKIIKDVSFPAEEAGWQNWLLRHSEVCIHSIPALRCQQGRKGLPRPLEV